MRKKTGGGDEKAPKFLFGGTLSKYVLIKDFLKNFDKFIKNLHKNLKKIRQNFSKIKFNRI